MKKSAIEWVRFLVMTSLALLWVVPLLWIVSTSFKSEAEAISGGFKIIPQNFVLSSYQEILFENPQTPILRWFINSLIIAISHTGIVLLICSMAAFSYARLRFKGKSILFGVILSTMMIPGIVNLIPVYKIVSQLGWIDTYYAMIFPSVGGAYGVFFLRQFMYGVPVEFDEAAKIDGASNLYIYMKIILPLIKPALIVLGLFTFMGNWNDFLWPSIVTNDLKMRTLPAGMRILQGVLDIEYSQLMAATVISAFPVFIIYLMVQKYFIKGISLSSGIKG